MARIVFDSELFAYKKLKEMEQVEDDMSGALYKGAGIVADAVRASIESLPVDDQPWKHETGEDGRQQKRSTITSAQKSGLLDGLGIAAHKKTDDSVHTRIGFHDYNSHYTMEHPNGEPNALVARSIESGTSFRKKTPFVRPAVRKVKAVAIEAMEKEFIEAQKRRIKNA